LTVDTYRPDESPCHITLIRHPNFLGVSCHLICPHNLHKIPTSLKHGRVARICHAGHLNHRPFLCHDLGTCIKRRRLRNLYVESAIACLWILNDFLLLQLQASISETVWGIHGRFVLYACTSIDKLCLLNEFLPCILNCHICPTAQFVAGIKCSYYCLVSQVGFGHKLRHIWTAT